MVGLFCASEFTPRKNYPLPQLLKSHLNSPALAPTPELLPLTVLLRHYSRFPCYTGLMKAHVWVMPKRTVLDPQGQTIHHALSGLGYANVSDVRQGKFFVLNLDGWSRDQAQQQLEKISKEVLTNPVIEEYRFEIID